MRPFPAQFHERVRSLCRADSSSETK